MTVLQNLQLCELNHHTVKSRPIPACLLILSRRQINLPPSIKSARLHEAVWLPRVSCVHFITTAIKTQGIHWQRFYSHLQCHRPRLYACSFTSFLCPTVSTTGTYYLYKGTQLFGIKLKTRHTLYQVVPFRERKILRPDLGLHQKFTISVEQAIKSESGDKALELKKWQFGVAFRSDLGIL